MPGSAPAHSMDANHKWSFRHWRCLTDKHLFQSRLKLSQVEIVKNEMEQRHKNNIDACCDFQIRLQDSFFQAHEIISLRYVLGGGSRHSILPFSEINFFGRKGPREFPLFHLFASISQTTVLTMSKKLDF